MANRFWTFDFGFTCLIRWVSVCLRTHPTMWIKFCKIAFWHHARLLLDEKWCISKSGNPVLIRRLRFRCWKGGGLDTVWYGNKDCMTYSGIGVHQEWCTQKLYEFPRRIKIAPQPTTACTGPPRERPISGACMLMIKKIIRNPQILKGGFPPDSLVKPGRVF